MSSNIVFIGAGGTGMSGLAMMLYDLGYHNIVCINDVESDLTNRLKNYGMKVVIGHGIYQVDFHDFVIYSDIQAIKDGPELQQSFRYQRENTKKFFHRCLTYHQFVGEITKRFQTVAVSGSNGKTSTTAMTIWVLHALSSLQKDERSFAEESSAFLREPKIGSIYFGLGLVGGLMPNFQNQGYVVTQDPQILGDIKHIFGHIFDQKHQLDYSLLKKYFFIVEADEYRDHLLSYDIDYLLLTNIVRDHQDYFTTRESYRTVFLNAIESTRVKVIMTEQARQDLQLQELSDILALSEDFPIENEFLLGSYTQVNAGLIVKLLESISQKDIFGETEESNRLSTTLSHFQGVGRRMEYLGELDGKKIYSDYGHHPPALEGNIRALKEKFPDKELCVIFQPHQAQRVLVGREDFQEVLSGGDTKIIYRFYTAREDFTSLQSQFDRLKTLFNFHELGERFALEIQGKYVVDIDNLAQSLQSLSEDTIIVVFSAGDLDKEIRDLLKIDYSKKN